MNLSHEQVNALPPCAQRAELTFSDSESDSSFIFQVVIYPQYESSQLPRTAEHLATSHLNSPLTAFYTVGQKREVNLDTNSFAYKWK